MHICDICKKKLVINDSELNENNSNITCHESEEDNIISTELTYNFLSESNILSNSNLEIEDIISYNLESELTKDFSSESNKSSISTIEIEDIISYNLETELKNNFSSKSNKSSISTIEIEDIFSYNSELSLKSENYQYSTNYSSGKKVDFVTNINIQNEVKNETI